MRSTSITATSSSVTLDGPWERGCEERGGEDAAVQEVGAFRRALPQILACMAKNLLLFDLGLSIGFPTIVIPVLRGLQADRNPDEIIHMTAEESTWVGSLLFLTEPLGSMSSGWITEQLGRKKSMILVNLPHITAWTMLYFAHSPAHVYIAASLLGLGAGLLGSPVAVYVGEISHPSIRGMLLSLSGICKSCGLVMIFLLGSLTHWRMAALYCLAVPLLAIAAITFVPETPHWLIAHRRPAEALRSLQWLRGWVSPQAVATEFAELNHYIEHADACDDCRLQRVQTKCTHPSTYAQKIRDLCRPKTLRPFGLLMLMFFVVQVSGNQAIRPFLVQIFQTFRLPIHANWASVVVGCADIVSGVFCIFAIPLFGKRRLFLVALLGVVGFCAAIAISAYVTFDLGTSSFATVVTADLEEVVGNHKPNDNYVALVLFIGLAACANVVNCMPWVLSSEVFPFRIRGTASGISSAFSYICIFAATKTYFNVERSMTIFGAFIFYGVISILGFIILYCIFPETENRSLEEIEYFFSDNTRRWNDRKIRRLEQTKQADGEDNAGYDHVELQEDGTKQ